MAAVVRELCVCRRELERRFRAVLGRSVLQEIHRARIDQAAELLLSTDLAMPDVAKGSGFSSAQRMAVVFRRVAGTTPAEFRRQTRVRQP